MAEGGVLQPDLTWLSPDGRRWDSDGNPIDLPIVEDDAPPSYTGVDPRIAQFRIASGLDPWTGDIVDSSAPSWTTQSAGGDDEFVPAGAIGTPQWMQAEEGMGFAGERSGTGPSSFSSAMRGTQVDEFGQPIIPMSAEDRARMQPIDYTSEGGYGSEIDIGRAWAQNQADRAERQRWEDVIRGDTEDIASPFTGQSSYAGTVMPDYSPQPLGPTKLQTAAGQPFDYAMEGGSVATDIALEKARAREAQAADIAAEEARQRAAILAAEADAANQFVTATQPRDIPATPYGTSFGGDDDFVTTPGGVGTPQPPAPIYYPEDDIAEYGPTAPPAHVPTPTPVAAPAVASPVPTPMHVPTPAPVVEVDTDAYAGRYYDEGADGMRTRDRLSLVGESGPELALFPNGTEIIPLDREMQPDQKRRLRRRGAFANAIDSFQFGGLVGGMGPQVSDLPPSAQVMPAGITEVMSGRPTRAPRSLFRQAGMRAPSAQTISNLLPEEIGVYQEMGRLAGIPDKAFEREFQSMVPMGQGGTRQARFTPRRTGRTRYGSI